MVCGVIDTSIWNTSSELSGRLWTGQPKAVQELHGARYEQLGHYFQRSGQCGLLPEEAAQTIGEALTSRRAKQIYYIGSDARLYRLFYKLVPERLRDWITLRTIGLDT